ncbi:hypothetical protein [Streptomyces spectabilis]|uniref:DUF4352 domain-containing protein n=1 Tax=Streptomyces spectabilis TaxID=68270 RepID=A0A516R3P8_STRST|nr:hypothetical protein [Streptomyces spectabilis]QDQ10279.1 hypothetical protein FH965_06650 [Streptomyces spectabilis]
MSNSAPPMPSLPPQPQPQRKSRTNAVVIGSAVAVIAAVVATGLFIVNSRDDEKSAATRTADSATSDEVFAGDEEPAEDEREPEDGEPQVFGLYDTVTYNNEVAVSLSKFSRGTSSSTAAPENTPYLKFDVHVRNGGTSTVDTTAFSVNCAYGEDGKEGELVIDSERGLMGGPSTRLLAGRSLTVTWACAVPKAEKTVQIEVSPGFETETAIFTGDEK